MPLLNRLLRWSGIAFLVVMAGAGAILGYLYLVVFPHIGDYRGTIESLLSSATGFQVKLDQVGGEWGGARPWFMLKGVKLYDRENNPVLQFDRLDGRFGWRSLLTLEPRFHTLIVDGSALTVRRTEDGKFHVGGITVDPQSPNHAFTDWLLKQGELTVNDLTLAWVDDRAHAPPLVMSGIRVDLKSLGSRHDLSISAIPPQQLAAAFEVNATLTGRTMSRPEAWSGTAKGTFRNLKIESLATWVHVPYIASGRGGLVLAAQIHKGQIDDIEMRLNMIGVSAQADEQSAAIRLRKLVGQLGWKSNPDGHIVQATGLSFLPEAGLAVGPINAQLGWTRTGYQVALGDLDLSALTPLVPLIPVEKSLRDRLIALHATGHVDYLQASWQKPSDQRERREFSVNGRFRQLGWDAAGKWPGVKGLDGSLEGTQDKGQFSLELRPGQVSLPALFRDGTIDWVRLGIAGGWSWKDDGYELRLAKVDMSNADLAGSIGGTYLFGSHGPDQMNLSGTLDHVLGAAVYKYIPKVVPDDTYKWLKQSIVAGNARQTNFVLRGQPKYFPFRNDIGGLFRIDSVVDGAVLRYANDWPSIDGIDGTLRFRGSQLEIVSDKAHIYNVQLHHVRVAIPDFGVKNGILDVNGEAVGPVGEFIRFANFSPVAERIDDLTDEMSGNGEMNLALNLKMPLSHMDDTTVAGRLSFNGDRLFPAPDVPMLEQVTGQLDFTEHAVTASRITAKLLGGPAVIRVASQDSKTHVFGQGVFTAASLGKWLGTAVGSQLSGQAGWTGEIMLAKGHPSVKVESNLIGLASTLPAPLAKQAGQAALLKVERLPLRDGSLYSSASYQNQLNAVWRDEPSPAGLRFERGEVRFGGKAQLPAQPGLLVVGYVRECDLGRWLDFAPPGSDEQSRLNGINLTFSSLELLGRRFTDVNLNGRYRGTILKVDVAGQDVEGSVAYRRATAAVPGRVSGSFKQLVIPPTQPALKSEGGWRISTVSFPSLDITIDDLRMAGVPLGRLEALAHGGIDGLVIDQLKLVNPDSTVSMSGVWKEAGNGATQVKLDTQISDTGKMLARYGYPDTVKRGKGSVIGDVAWQGSPADFSFATLTGTLNLKAQNGQFLKVNPGAAKLLGVISLQSIPRRLKLDFRDVFSGGFAFDEISATLRIVAGNVYSDDFQMKGPAATVKMSGLARLADETVQLRIKVSPKLSEGVAVAGALISGPLAGLGALVVQKVFKDPIEEATSFEYMVSGPWDEPNVSKLSKPKTLREFDKNG
jgi:uncharacterized protein (TIGR02099 family)